MTNKSFTYFILLICFSFLNYPSKVLAHGVSIHYQQTQGIEIQANYDDGTPMKNAQVVIYAPNAPTTPWLKGDTDNNGHFIFIPDANLKGNWDVKVRQGGHGTIISIPINKTNENSPNNSDVESTNQNNQIVQATVSNSEFSIWQKLIMATTVSWGCIGTALFFSRKRIVKE